MLCAGTFYAEPELNIKKIKCAICSEIGYSFSTEVTL